eukprot:TRINITY_DN4508_c0_g1_i1.p1 TRINITY_DN4508_c0_g1~~TRINITY_DN4508_c0_g1_i1.p1  ORF type:complete len:596 (-),score=97.43 TRINITY_DN4508_c0_g1_i1:115-1902(-)
MAACTFTLEQLRSELQRTVRAELQSLRDVLGEEMQKNLDQAGFACSRGDRPGSMQQPEVVKGVRRPGMLQWTGDKTASVAPAAHALCQEAPARPGVELQPVAKHGMMPKSDSEERLLQLHASPEQGSGSSRRKTSFKPAKSRMLAAQHSTQPATFCDMITMYARVMVGHHFFDYTSASIVILNAVWIGHQTNYVATNWAVDTPTYFKTGDDTFCLLAVIEVIIRMVADGSEFFVGFGWRWNWFDLVLATSQVADVVMNLIDPDAGHNKALRLLRVCKLIRIARIARIAAAFPELHVLISSVVDSLTSLFWTLLLIGAFLFAVSIAITQIVNEHKIERGVEHMEAHEEAILEYYGSLPHTMLSLYMIISEGIHWGELMEPLAEYVSPNMKVVFVVFVAFQLFAMMNVITAIFVDNAMKIASKEERDEVLGTLWAEMSADVGREGQITPEVFANHFESPAMQRFLELTGAGGEDADTVFSLIDASGDGQLDASEFVGCCGRLVGGARAMQVAQSTASVKNHVDAQVQMLQDRIGSSSSAPRDKQQEIMMQLNEVMMKLEKLTPTDPNSVPKPFPSTAPSSPFNLYSSQPPSPCHPQR